MRAGSCKGAVVVVEACSGDGLSAGLAVVAAQPDPGASTIVAAGYGHTAITVCTQKHFVRMGEQQLKSSPFIRTKRCDLMKRLLVNAAQPHPGPLS